MVKKIQNIVYPLLAGRIFYDDDELYLYLILLVANTFAGLMYLLMLCSYLVMGQLLMAAVTAACIVLFPLCYYLIVHQRNYLWSGLLITVDVVFYTMLSLLWVGPGHFFLSYLFVVLMMQIIVPYAKTWLRGLMLFIIWCCMMTALGLQIHDQARVELLSGQDLYLFIFNINLFFLATLTELSIGSILRKIITHYNYNRMIEFETQAHTDVLTGLYNRRYANLLFKNINAEHTSMQWCIAMLDIDDFKKINDTYGHSVGDLVLKQVADIIRQSLRKADVVIRWGGEEFLLLIDDVHPVTAFLVLEKLRISIAETVFLVDGLRLQFTVTIGLDELNLRDIADSIKRCDRKMYKGKAKGKNCVIY